MASVIGAGTGSCTSDGGANGSCKDYMHTFKNIAQQAGEQLLFVYPAGLEQFFREVYDLGLKMPQDFNALNDLSNSKYGVWNDRA